MLSSGRQNSCSERAGTLSRVQPVRLGGFKRHEQAKSLDSRRDRRAGRRPGRRVRHPGVVPPTPIRANPAKYIAKVYVFCPGREVRVQINKISRHRFANAKEAGVSFFQLSAEEKQTLIDQAAPVLDSWGEKIGKDYLNTFRTALAK